MTDYEKLTAEELSNALCGLQMTSLKAATCLSFKCGDGDEARRQIRLALDMPPRVLQRTFDKASAKIEADGDLTVAELAAWIACNHHSVQLIAAALERKQVGAPLQ